MARWRDIESAWNYEVSDEGQVRNKKTGRILKTYKNNHSGRPQVTMMDAGFRVTRQIHTLIKNAYGE